MLATLLAAAYTPDDAAGRPSCGTDAALIARLRAGDERALESVFRRLVLPLSRFARRVGAGLERVGLAGRGRDRVGGFSKGMQQRLVLAQALLPEPELLILDEPTSALDPVGRKEVRDIILEAHARGTTVLLNSHLLSEVEAVCDQVAVLRRGKLVRQGAVRALAHGELEVEARVGGYTDAVAAALTPHVQGLRVEPPTDEPWTTLRFALLSEEALPFVSAAILGAGGALYALVPSRESLEELFLRLVEEPS